MEQLYYEYKQILEEKLPALDFKAHPESTAGLGRSITFEKDDFQIQWVFDLRDQILTLQAVQPKKEKRLAGRVLFSSSAKLKSDFLQELNGILANQGLKIEIPAPPEKSGNFLSKLFGKK